MRRTPKKPPGNSIFLPPGSQAAVAMAAAGAQHPLIRTKHAELQAPPPSGAFLQTVVQTATNCCTNCTPLCCGLLQAVNILFEKRHYLILNIPFTACSKP